MSKKLIDVDMWVESHERGTKDTRSTGSHGGAGFSQSSHTDRADRADIADRAEAADEANHAKESDHAKTADEANHAKKADEATTADEAYKAYKLLDNYPKFKGVTAEEYVRTKEITSQNIQNSDTITTKNINVTGKATFFELEIQKAKAAGGMTIYSPGAFHVDAVVDAGSYYACYQRAEQDGVKLMQMCEVDDQLMCARFNVGGNGNKFYWMRVAYASPNTVQRVVDGKFVDYLEVRLDKSVKADNCQGVPEVGDALAVVGNRTKEERQSVIVISAYNSLDIELRAPYIAQYENVNNFDLKNKKTTWLAKGENHLTGTFTVVSGGKKVSLDNFVTKISQATFKVEADKITARIDGIEKTQKTTVEKFAQLETTVDSITSTVARKSDLEEVRTEIKQTAESISLKVENGARPNLLWSSDFDLDGVDTTNKRAIQKHLGVGLNVTKVDSTEWFEYLKGGGVGGSDAIKFYTTKDASPFAGLYWEVLTGASHNLRLKPNTVYTLSAWIRTEFDKDAQGYSNFVFEAFKKEKEDSAQRVGNLSFKTASSWFEPINEWTRVSTSFTTEELKYGSVAMWINGKKPATLYICRPKLEEGNTATPWCAYDGTVEALLASGLDIKNRKTIATTDNFVVQNNRGEQTFMVDENGRINNGLLSLDGLDAKRAVIKRLRFQSNSVAPYFVTEESIKEFAAYCTRYYAGYGAKPLLPFDVAMFFVFLIKPKWLTNIDQGYNKDFSQRSRDIAVSESMARSFQVDYFSFALELFWHNMVGKTVTIANATNENISFGVKLKTRVFDSNGKNVMQIGGRLDNLPNFPERCVERINLLPGQIASFKYTLFSGAPMNVLVRGVRTKGFFLLQDLFDFSYYKKLFEVGYDTEQGFNLFDKKYIDLFNTDKEHVEPKGGFPKTKRKY